MKTLARYIVIPAVIALIGGCMGDSGTGSGQMSLAVTDAPVDNATKVVVEFTGVEVQGDSGMQTFTFSAPRQIDLLTLQGTSSATLLDNVTLPAGHYNWIRLDITAGPGQSNSFVELDDGSMHSIVVPSGSQTGLKLVRGFNVPVGGSADFTIDFDLRKSVVNPQDASTDYLLKPALRIVDNTEVGSIDGTVDMSLITTGCTPAIYVYEGSDATPAEMTTDTAVTGSQPITSANVTQDATSGLFTYKVGFLAAGDYTLAFTCDAAKDDPEANDGITFGPVHNATVVANQTTTVDFP